MKNNLLLFYALLFISTSSVFSQWRYENIKDLKEDLVVIYTVKYDKQPTAEQRKSQNFTKRVVLCLNQDYIIKKEIKNKNTYQKIIFLDYKNEIGYNCYKFKDYKAAVPFDFETPLSNATLQKDETKNIAGIDCQKYTSIFRGESIDLYSTKEIGLRYVGKYNIPGFLMESKSYDPVLGFYTLKAVKIKHTKLAPKLFSLDEYEKTTLKKHNKNIHEYIEKVRKENELIQLSRKKAANGVDVK